MSKKIIILIVFILSFVIGAFLYAYVPNKLLTANPTATINNQVFYLKIADTPDKRAKGLSNISKIGKNQAMLFIFPNLGQYPFWMKDMQFNLDFIFLDNNKVVDLAKNVPYPKKNEEPKTIIPTVDFNRVLELNKGIIDQLKIKTGDQISFSL